MDLALFIAGFMGSLVQIGGKTNLGFWGKFTAIMSGGAIANYLTPVLVSLFDWSASSRYGFGFLLGFMGLKGVEVVIKAIKSRLNVDTKEKEDV